MSTFTWTATSDLQAVTLEKFPSAKWNQAMANLDAGNEERFLPASALRDAGTSPTFVASGGSPYWSFADGVNNTVAGAFNIPEGWVTANLIIRWANLGAGSGNVRWQLVRDLNGAGDAINTGDVTTLTTTTAPAQNIVAHSTLFTAVSVTPGKTLGFVLTRLGSDGADTLGNAAGLGGVELRRAS